MPFFTSGKTKTKLKGRKRPAGGQDVNVKGSSSARKIREERLTARLAREEEASSSDEEQLEQVKRWKGEDGEEDREEEEETVQEKKERIAQEFIKEHEQQRAESDADAVSLEQQLREEVLEVSGKLFRKVAHKYSNKNKTEAHIVTVLQCKKFQRKTITCVAINPKDNSIFSSSLDGSIIKYSADGVRLAAVRSAQQARQDTTSSPRHAKEVFALAVSSDGKYLVSGDGAGVMHVWNPATLSYIDTLKKHRKPVTGLVFQRGTHNLYSCSLDRLVMEWSLENMAYVDNLGGHSCGVQAIDALYRQSCISCGGSDETVIIYSIVEDKQFQFQTSDDGKQISIDGVKLLNESTFITFGQDGSLCLWTTGRKKPVQQLRVAHGFRKEGRQEPHWITALATMVNTDLVASGSSDGFIRLWRVDSRGGNKLHALTRIPIPAGFVNSLEFTADGTALVAALARTHKHGRWFVDKKAKNCVLLIKFPQIQPKLPLENSLLARRNRAQFEENADQSCGDSGRGEEEDDISSGDKNGDTVSSEVTNEEVADEEEEDEEEEEKDDQSDSGIARQDSHAASEQSESENDECSDDEENMSEISYEES